MKILVTGGSGFIGSYLVKKILEENEVIIFDNGFRVGYSNISDFENVTLIKGDIQDQDCWKKLPKDVDISFHLAAINGTRFFYEIPEKVLNVNVQGILNFFDWLKNTAVKRIFFASSSEVYGFPKVFPTPETEPLTIPDITNPRFSYSSSKIIGEALTINIAKKLGIDFTIGRFHNVYGPKMGFEHVIPEFVRKCVMNEKFSVQGNGEESRSFCYITDAIEGILLSTLNERGKNKIFNIGSSEETTINELIKKIETIHGEKINPEYKKFEQSGTKRRVPDISKIKELGYEPKVNLEKGLEMTYDWYRSYYLKNKP